MRQLIALFCLWTSVHAFKDGPINVVGMAITVGDMEEARTYYTDVLGGMRVPELSLEDGLQGEEYQYRFFQKEMLEVPSGSGGDADESFVAGIPWIGDKSRLKVRWDFIVFGNMFVMLIQFYHIDSGEPVGWKVKEIGDSIVGKGHLAFWPFDFIDPIAQMEAIRETGKDYDYVVYDAVKYVDSKTKIYDLDASDLYFDATIPQGGPNITFFYASQGVVSEKLEWGFRNGSAKDGFIQPYCKEGAVHPALQSSGSLQLNVDDYQRDITQKVYGSHHIGFTVRDKDEMRTFLTEVMGGKFQSDLSFTLSNSDTGYYFQFLAAQLAAESESRPADADFGITDISADGDGAVDFEWILFDNTMVEPTYFHNGGTLASRTIENTSPAYINTIALIFNVKENVDFNQAIKEMEKAAEDRGMPQVKANRLVEVQTFGQDVPLENYSRPLTEGDLEGFNFVLFKGPSDQQMMLTQFKGKAREALKKAFKKYGAMSTMFSETNPWCHGGFPDTCGDMPDFCGGSSIVPGAGVIFTTIILLAILQSLIN